MDIEERRIDSNDASLTENTRASYPLSSIPRRGPRHRRPPEAYRDADGDAFGCFRRSLSMTTDQAMYHFLSGYTA